MIAEAAAQIKLVRPLIEVIGLQVKGANAQIAAERFRLR